MPRRRRHPVPWHRRPWQPLRLPAPGPSVAVGEEGVLEGPGAEGAWMTVSLDDYRALVAADADRGRRRRRPGRGEDGAGGVGALPADEGRAQRDPRPGAGREIGGLYVEALDGADVGRSGWVDSWSVRALPAAAGVRGRGA